MKRLVEYITGITMGMLINGELANSWLDKEIEEGEFKRMESFFRHWITADGKAGPTGNAGFKAEADRYHLYVSEACPWAPPIGWCIITREWVNAERLPSAPATSNTAAMLAAIPVQMVATSLLMNCMVS